MKCISCYEGLTEDVYGIKCEENHGLCYDCSRVFVNFMFSEPQFNIPPRCPNCKNRIIVSTVEMQLTPLELDNFQSLMSIYEQNLHATYKPSRTAFNRLTSSYLNRRNGGLEINESDKDYDLYCKIEKAFEYGSTTQCPQCKTHGRKDDSCTHISCTKCRTRFCYICGLTEEMCDKSAGSRNIFGHNNDWETNELRCPRYLYWIHRIDTRWPRSLDEIENLDYFHKIKTIKLLKKLFSQENLNNIREFEDKYKVLSKAGFKIDAILRTNTTFIIRKAPEIKLNNSNKSNHSRRKSTKACIIL